MRLIDVDALKASCEMADDCLSCPRKSRRCNSVLEFTRMDVCELLDNAPTANYDEDMGTITICALRYAIGRQTYMPSLVQDFVRRHPEIVNENVKQIMLRDINEADRIREHKLPNGEILTIDGLGSTTIDRPGWLNFRSWLEGLDCGKEKDR